MKKIARLSIIGSIVSLGIIFFNNNGVSKKLALSH